MIGETDKVIAPCLSITSRCALECRTAASFKNDSSTQPSKIVTFAFIK